jgi:carbamoyl-phosphate synthase large subunit
VVRPSYVLGGRAMEIVHGDKDLERYMREAVRVSDKSPVLLDRFLDDAVEVDVDCIADASGAVMIGGIMEHIEQAGVHSGDSACSLPPYTLSAVLQDELRRQTALMAKALKVIGLMNVQFAIQGDVTAGLDACTVYVLEVNPRASRTVPYVSKATGQPLAKIAARCMAGQLLAEQKDPNGQVPHEVIPPYFSVKEAVFPFNKFPGVDPILSPEMRSTGEVMGVGKTFAEAMLKSQLGAGSRLPRSGNVVISVKSNDHARAVVIARELHALGFGIVATKGTAAAIAAGGVPVKVVNKVKDGRPHIADIIKSGDIQLVFTTVDETRTAIADSRHIRTAALANRVTYYTTMAGCEAATEALKHQDGLSVVSLQELHAELH